MSDDDGGERRSDRKPATIPNLPAPSTGLSQVEAYCSQFGRHQLKRYLLPCNSDTSLSTTNLTTSDDMPMSAIDIDTRMVYLDQIYNPICTKSNFTDTLNKQTISKSEESLSEISKEIQDDDVENQDQLINKTVSPPSSVTSRKLEWDSLADIGYANVDQIKIARGNPLSTIERMALETHHKSDLTVDFEGDDAFKSSVHVKFRSTLGTPDAQSTPLIGPVIAKCSNRNTKKMKEFASPYKSVKPKVNLRKRSVSKYKRKHTKFNLKRNISINVDVNTKDSQSESNSNSNVEQKEGDANQNPLSIVERLSKSIQTSASSQNSEISPIISGSATSLKNTERDEEIQTPSFNLQQETQTSSSLSHQENCDIVAMISTMEDNNANSDESLLSKAQSFEFMPGHVYYEKYSPNDDKPPSPKTTVESNPQSARKSVDLSEQTSAGKYDFKLSTYPPKKQNVSNVDAVNELVHLRHTDPVLKKRLAKKILQLLDKTDVSSNSNSDFISIDSQNQTGKDKTLRIVIKDSECQTENANPNVPKSEPVDTKIIEDPNENSSDSGKKSLKNAKIQNINKYCQTSPNSSSSFSSKLSKDSDKRTLYDEYLKSKMREKLLKKEYVVKKMSDCSPKKATVLPLKSRNQIAGDIASTERELKKINDEILKLVLLKLKLENKHESKSTSKSLSSNSSEFQTQGADSYDVDSKTFSGHYAPNINIEVPSLNLKSSSDELNDISEQRKLKSPVKSKSSHSEKSDINKAYKPDSADTVKGTRTCNCNSKNEICCFCDYSKSNSDAISSDSKEPIDAKMKRLKENYTKYQKCKVMRAFMKDYDALIAKYQQMKVSPTERVSQKIRNGNEKLTQRISLEKETSRSAVKQDCQDLDSNLPKFKLNACETEEDELELIKNKFNFLLSGTSTPHAASEINQRDDSKMSTSRSKAGVDQSTLKEMLILMKRFEKHLNTAKNSPVAKTDMTTQVTPSMSTNSKLSTSQTGDNIDQSVLNEMLTLIKKFEKRLNLAKSSLVPKIDMTTQVTPSVSMSSKQELKNKATEKPKSSSDKIVEEVQHSNENKIIQKENAARIKLPCPCKIKNDLIKCKKALKQSKTYPKSIAYNLILEPSESIIDESIQMRSKNVLDEIVVKVPKTRHKMNDQVVRDVKERASAVTQLYLDSMGSTDEQLKDMSSLNDDNATTLSSVAAEDQQSTPKYIVNELNDEGKSGGGEFIRKNTMTVEDYLNKNRPRFADKADKRQEYIREFYDAKKNYETQRRKLLEKDILNIADLKGNGLPDAPVLKYNKLPLPVNRKIFNAKDIVKRTARRCQRLPEVLERKRFLKKERQTKANRLMSELFVKKLQQKALKGIVNISHNSDIISL
ncbi:uncharacterized protein LOC143917786 [Arctopsyche grandis]|uniref:uncharacterized protein LOC143917786 n=1 Tax=Arctopsyche grandis TaxID=121162 RepID=UPI00406D8303